MGSPVVRPEIRRLLPTQFIDPKNIGPADAGPTSTARGAPGRDSSISEIEIDPAIIWDFGEEPFWLILNYIESLINIASN